MYVIGYSYIIDKQFLPQVSNTYSDIIAFINNTNNTVLLVYKDNYKITSNYNDISNLYEKVRVTPISIDILNYMKNILISNKDPVLNIFEYDELYICFGQKNKLKLLTFNISAKVQLNKNLHNMNYIPANFKMVKKCQELYPSTYGYSNISNNKYTISQCTKNTLDWIFQQNCDIIALQEVIEKYLSIYNTLIPNLYDYIEGLNLMLIYNIDKLGKLVQLNLNTYVNKNMDNKPILIGLSIKLKLLIINIHIPHILPNNINRKEYIEQKINMNKIFSNYDIERVIIMGDFNDTLDNSLEQLNYGSLTLKQHNRNDRILSCCYDSSYKYPSDYIFDSDYLQYGIYDIPEDSKSIAMSDHYPVLFTPNNK